MDFKLMAVGFPLPGGGVVTREVISSLAGSFKPGAKVRDRSDFPGRMSRVLGTVERLEVRADGDELWAITNVQPSKHERLAPAFAVEPRAQFLYAFIAVEEVKPGVSGGDSL